MRALCLERAGAVAVRQRPEPRLVGRRDALVRVRLSSVCGSDLHLIDGRLPSARPGDVLGHELVGEVVEVGPDVRALRRGDWVVVAPGVACGGCGPCRAGEWALCDNGVAGGEEHEARHGDTVGGLLGAGAAFGGYDGSHAEYVRVPFADRGAFRLPDEIGDEAAVFLSDAAPTGYMAAELCGVRPGDTVAVWGCGAVKLMAIRCAYLLGAERVIAIDRFPARLAAAQTHGRAEVVDDLEFDVPAALREMTGGRGPDACIDAAGAGAHGAGLSGARDRLAQAVRPWTDRASALREAIRACRKGGRVAVVGLYGGAVDDFPLGAAMIKGLTLRLGLQHGPRYLPAAIQAAARGALDPRFLLTHLFPLEEGARGYELFRRKADGCLRVVFAP